MRGRIGRLVRQSGSGLGATDWGSILDAVKEAAPVVIDAAKSITKKPATTTSGGTVYNVTNPTKKKQTDYTPWLIGGGLLLAAGTAVYLNSNNSNRKK